MKGQVYWATLGASGAAGEGRSGRGGWGRRKGLECQKKEFEICCESSWEPWEALKWGRSQF